MDIRNRRVTSKAIQVHGGGFAEEFSVSRFYRGARCGTLGGGTSETLKDPIGRRIIAGVDPVDGILRRGASGLLPPARSHELRWGGLPKPCP